MEQQQKSKVYNIYLETNMQQSLYTQILLQRPYWQIHEVREESSLCLGFQNIEAEAFNKRTRLGILFNHLPGSSMLIDVMKVFQVFQNKRPDDVFRHFRFTYHLGTDYDKFKQHVQSIQNATSMKINPSKEQQAQQEAKKLKDSGIQMAIDQEIENDKLWGSQNLNPLCRLSVISKPVIFEKRAVSSSTLTRSKSALKSPSLMAPLSASVSIPALAPLNKNQQKPRSSSRQQPQRSLLELAYTPLEYNTMNRWQISTQPPTRITQTSEIQPWFNRPGLYAIKECESILKHLNRELFFTIFCLVLANGDCFIYEKPICYMKSQFESKKIVMQKDCDYVSESQVDLAIDYKKQFTTKIKQQMKESVKQIIQLFRGTLVNSALCTSCFELFTFDFQIGQVGRGKYQHFLTKVQSTPNFQLDSAMAWSVYPRLIDDMFYLTIDQILKPSETVIPHKYKSVFEVVRKNALNVEIAKQKKSKDEIVLEDEDVYKRISLENRKLDGLRWSGGRTKNGFVQVLQRWSEYKGTDNK
ncbi:Tubulin_tyrosine ligase [Hexamita inflata]|uniref:Tubulin tyrosine ligase n=1 Tax=Hexamita inflata TaxID=28002 RepID=A0AA86QGG0_9EUKA|nr:Tubulin tyrosine ligase [Hexamita inflata]